MSLRNTIKIISNKTGITHYSCEKKNCDHYPAWGSTSPYPYPSRKRRTGICPRGLWAAVATTGRSSCSSRPTSRRCARFCIWWEPARRVRYPFVGPASTRKRNVNAKRVRYCNVLAWLTRIPSLTAAAKFLDSVLMNGCIVTTMRKPRRWIMFMVSFIVGNLFWSSEKSPISACQNSFSSTWPTTTPQRSRFRGRIKMVYIHISKAGKSMKIINCGKSIWLN